MMAGVSFGFAGVNRESTAEVALAESAADRSIVADSSSVVILNHFKIS
jgi:hypothetical protein